MRQERKFRCYNENDEHSDNSDDAEKEIKNSCALSVNAELAAVLAGLAL